MKRITVFIQRLRTKKNIIIRIFPYTIDLRVDKRTKKEFVRGDMAYVQYKNSFNANLVFYQFFLNL